MAAGSEHVAVVALGSYGRNELCPGSDVDIMVLHDGVPAIASIAEGIWYPLWDAGLVLGHATRTVGEAFALAERDLDTLTSLVDVRRVAGDAVIVRDLVERARNSCERRSSKVLDELADAAEQRHARFGAVADMLEPNLKEGEGGLRDLHSLVWAGFALGSPGGLGALVERGFLRPDDPARLRADGERLLDVRVALHRVTGARTDVLALQEQDAVAALIGARDADVMMRDLARAAREVAWIAEDVRTGMRLTNRARSRVLDRDRGLGASVQVRDGRVAASVDSTLNAALVLRIAEAAASLDAPIDRETLERMSLLDRMVWTSETRESFRSLLRSGRPAIAVFDAMDYSGVLTVLLPEWALVRALPQRNAYHRFTVDHHLLETVAECAAILDEEGFDGAVARACPSNEVLLLGALFHDFGKGQAGDHSVIGAELAMQITHRLGLDASAVDTVGWLVRNHLLLADTATRRDLSDEATIARFARAVGDADRLRLLYVLTVGDSRATGPAAWGPAKAALVVELFLKTEGLLERGEVLSSVARQRRAALRDRLGAGDADRFLDGMPPSYALSYDVDAMVDHRGMLEVGRFAIRWRDLGAQELECVIVSPDQTGLLAHVAGSLALVGFDIRDAAAYTQSDGRALEIYRGFDRFGRLADAVARDDASDMIRRSVMGEVRLDDELRQRVARYRAARRGGRRGEVVVTIDLEGSDFATIVEIHADDEIGVLARVARTIADFELDVSTAKVATLGDRVVDVFYVRDATGAKLGDVGEIARLRGALVACLRDDEPPPSST